MKERAEIPVKRGLKIGVALVLILIGMALLPLIALPYGSLDWLVYDPAYKGCYGFPSIPCPSVPCPSAVTTPEIPCAELPQPGELLVARVNDQGIRLQAYERELNQLLSALVALGADPESEEFQTELPAHRRQVLDLLIEDVLVQQAAVEMGITVSQQQIEQRMAEAVAESGGLEAFQAWLDETGQTWEEFRRDVCQDLLRQAVQERVTAGMPDAVDMVRARQIVVATENEAVAALSRLASGEAFEAVAAEVSLDEQTREQGGDLGWFPRGFGWVPPDVEDAVFDAAPGQVRGPIQVDEAYVVAQTVEYESNRPLDPEMSELLRAIAFEQWLAARREVARIEILIDPDAPNE